MDAISILHRFKLSPDINHYIKVRVKTGAKNENNLISDIPGGYKYSTTRYPGEFFHFIFSDF